MIVGSSKRETCAKIGRRVFAAPGSLRGRSARQSACTCSGEEHDEGKSTAKSARKSAPSHRSADLGADSKEAIREMFFSTSHSSEQVLLVTHRTAAAKHIHHLFARRGPRAAGEPGPQVNPINARAWRLNALY
jgi:hypothetical protein